MIRKDLDITIEKAADRSRTFRFIGSDEKPDRYGDIVEVDGWDTENWMKNPVVLWGHNKAMPPIGRGIAVTKKQRPKRLVFDVEFASEETYEFAGTIGKLVEGGFIKAVSVGFIPKESEPIDPEDDSWFAPRRYKKQELLEMSIVSVPANPGALMVLNMMDRLRMRKAGCGFDFSAVMFDPDKFSEEQAKDWLISRGYDAKSGFEAVQVHGYPALQWSVGQNLDFDNLELVDIEAGIKGYLGTVKEPGFSYQLQFPSFSISQPDDGPYWQTNDLFAEYHKTVIELFQRNNLVLDELNRTIKDLTKLAEVLDSDRDLPVSGKKKPVDKVAEELEKNVLQEASRLDGLLKT